jgi:hypothetical protein
MDLVPGVKQKPLSNRFVPQELSTLHGVPLHPALSQNATFDVAERQAVFGVSRRAHKIATGPSPLYMFGLQEITKLPTKTEYFFLLLFGRIECWFGLRYPT